MASQTSMPPSLTGGGPCPSSTSTQTTNVNQKKICATKEQTGSYQCSSVPSATCSATGERCPGPETSSTPSFGLEGMSALWPECREFLGKTNLGACSRGLFNFEQNTVFLNHNAYGTAAKPVLQAQAHFVNQLEMNPDRFMRRELPVLLRKAASKLAEFLNAETEDVVFVTNATTGMNAVLRSLDLQEGDEVLCLNLTYPAVLNTLRHICYCTQEFVELKVVDVTLPVPSYEFLVQQVAASITSNTRLAVLDHIASATGFVLPLEQLIPLFHSKGIPVLVDGASAPGQLPLNLKELGADFYVGNCYKWLFGSKSCAFLHVNKEYQTTVRPAVTSLCYGQSFVEDFSVQGTRDEANFLTIVTALDFYESVGFERVFQYNKNLMAWATEYLAKLWNTRSLLPQWQRAPFVSNVRLPIEWPIKNNQQPLTKEEVIIVCDAVMDLLLDHFGIVVRVAAFQGAMYARISAQMYNEKADYEKLGAAVVQLTKTKTLADHLAELSIDK